MSDKGGLEGLLSEVERQKKLDEIMIEPVNSSSKHQDRNATMYHPVTGEMKKTGLRVVVGFNDGPLNQTLSSGNAINQEGDLQNVNTVGWRVRILVCLCLIFLSTFSLSFLTNYTLLNYILCRNNVSNLFFFLISAQRFTCERPLWIYSS